MTCSSSPFSERVEQMGTRRNRRRKRSPPSWATQVLQSRMRGSCPDGTNQEGTLDRAAVGAPLYSDGLHVRRKRKFCGSPAKMAERKVHRSGGRFSARGRHISKSRNSEFSNTHRITGGKPKTCVSMRIILFRHGNRSMVKRLIGMRRSDRIGVRCICIVVRY